MKFLIDVCEELGAIKIILLGFLIIGVFTEKFRGLCIPIIALAMVVYMYPMLLSVISNFFTGGKRGAGFVNLLAGIVAFYSVAALIYLMCNWAR